MSLTHVETSIEGLMLFELARFGDDRGSFMETWSEPKYAHAGVSGSFVQDNLSHSRKGVLRGMHFQNPRAQGKLVSCLRGSVFDAVVDLRVSSETFGKWYGVELSAENRRQLWIPPGFAHGFLTLEDDTLFLYKCTDTYTPGAEGAIAWNDPDVGIAWPLERLSGMEPLLSPKDAVAPRFATLEREKLFP